PPNRVSTTGGIIRPAGAERSALRECLHSGGDRPAPALRAWRSAAAAPGSWVPPWTAVPHGDAGKARCRRAVAAVDARSNRPPAPSGADEIAHELGGRTGADVLWLADLLDPAHRHHHHQV